MNGNTITTFTTAEIFTRCRLPEVAAWVNEPAASGRAGRSRRASQFLTDEGVLTAEQFHRQSIVGRLRER